LDILQADLWLCVGAAALCGAIVGLERQLRGKPAGIRTSMLICLGTAIFVRLGSLEWAQGGDPARILGQVVTGIGFIGAGVILARHGSISGVTSAAVIWVLAALGAVVGLRYYVTGIVLSLVAVAVLVGIQFVENRAFHLRKGGYESEHRDDDAADE
jgi:putative Mg2+ transporter-C (MgtC) family protein